MKVLESQIDMQEQTCMKKNMPHINTLTTSIVHQFSF